MKATEQIEAIKKTLIDAEKHGQLSIDMFTIIERQLITLQILVERDIVTAEQKGLTDAFDAINTALDAKGEYYAKELTDDEKQAYHHEEEKRKQIILNHLK
jgi:hypothetical protein